MKDEFKKFVDKNRDEFENHNVDLDSLWSNIEKGIEKKSKKANRQILRYAAMSIAAVMLVFISYVFINYSEGQKTYGQGFELAHVSEELAEAEFYYSSQIEEKLKIINTSNKELGNLANENLAPLESMYLELKKDLKDGADNQEVIQAMIQSYRMRLHVLEQILNELESKEDDIIQI